MSEEKGTCPRCGAPACRGWESRLFECHSHYLKSLGDEFIQAESCLIRQQQQTVATLAERVNELEAESESARWFVADHDRGDARLRGPYSSPSVASAVREDMERSTLYSQMNLWIVSTPNS
jgi:hypothetical protein